MTARLRTGYSFRVGVGVFKEVISRIQECGFSVAPVTDTASTFAWVRWEKACKDAGLRPVYGVELAVSPSLEAKKPATDNFTFLAIDRLYEINTLVGLATRQFRYQPLLSYEQVNASEGVIKIAGRRADLEKLVIDGNTFVAASPSATLAYLKQAIKLGLPLIACSDNYYPREGDEGFYQVVIGRGASSQTYPRHILSDSEWTDFMVDEVGLPREIAIEALSNRDTVLSRCTAVLPKGKLLSPIDPVPLRVLCEQAAPGLKIDLSDPIYKARFDRELDMIEHKKFEDYFHIVGDLVRWARKNMTVGPARGSSCGSLVCYLLGITTIDPIPYGLLFERFLDINRNDFPDIDIDFSHMKRDLAFTYLEEKYGKERVARLGTVAMFKAASAMNEAAGALRIGKWETAPVMDAIIKRFSGDSRALDTLGDALKDSISGRKLLLEHPEIEIATRLEGHPRHYSQHASGIILTDVPVAEYVAVDARTGAVQCDKKDAETLDLLKIDALGLIQLSIFEDALRMAGLPHDHLDSIPLDDKGALAILNARHYAGIFQFNGPALQNVANCIQFDSLEDLIAVTALARPGPLASGGTDHWIWRKNGTEKITYPHPAFEPMTSNSFGIVIYQEQVMQIGRVVGGLSWEDVTDLRKAMSKSLGKEFFDKYGDRWKAGAIANGLPPGILNKVWDDLCVFGSWGFNRSHSVAYGIVSYWCCWLKHHYTIEFAAASLNHEKDPEKQISFLRELSMEGIDYIPAHEEFSIDEWSVGEREGKKILIGPLTAVKGLGPKMANAVMSARARGEPIPARARKLLANPKTDLDTLFPVRDRINEIMPDPRARNIYTPNTPIRRVLDSTDEKEVLVFACVIKIVPRNDNEEIKIAKRGGVRRDGPTDTLNLTLRDDTGQIFSHISRYDFEQLAKPVIERGRPGKVLYAIKGRSWGNETFRGISIDAIRFIGETA
jgi:DNA polymerase III alpha subunit